MIGILSNNIEVDFYEKLNIPFILIDDIENLDVDGLFIDWVPKLPVYEDAWMKQASLLQSYITSNKTNPVVIYDRNFSLTKKEVDWIKKFNVHLFEPALRTRPDFQYLPEWISNFDIVMDEEYDEDRKYDLVYSFHDLELNIKEFENWFNEYALIFPDKKVAYSSFTKINDFKQEEYKNNNLIYLHQHHPIFNEGAFTLAIDSKRSYEIGYFNRMYFFAMGLGCLPLLPVEHKYFHGIFKNLIVSDLKEMNFYISTYDGIKDIIIKEIFDRIKADWPEFTIEYATYAIRKCYE
jgi:hypothetical protein